MTENNPRELNVPLIFPGREPQEGRMSRDPYQERYVFLLAAAKLNFPFDLGITEHNNELSLRLTASPSIVPRILGLYQEFSRTELSRMLHFIEETDTTPFRVRLTGDKVPIPPKGVRWDEEKDMKINRKFAERAFVTAWERFLRIMESGDDSHLQHLRYRSYEDIERKIYGALQMKGVKPYHLGDLRDMSVGVLESILKERPELAPSQG
jgi:hypothetical protein